MGEYGGRGLSFLQPQMDWCHAGPSLSSFGEKRLGGGGRGGEGGKGAFGSRGDNGHQGRHCCHSCLQGSFIADYKLPSRIRTAREPQKDFFFRDHPPETRRLKSWLLADRPGGPQLPPPSDDQGVPGTASGVERETALELLTPYRKGPAQAAAGNLQGCA